MNKNVKIIVTGGAGFIGSNLVKKLNILGYKNIYIVDHLKGRRNKSKQKNLQALLYEQYLEADEFLLLIEKYDKKIRDVKVLIHLGARTDTTEKDKKFLIKNNTNYSKTLFKYCTKNNIRFIYASSAATYGDGSKGYNDKERMLSPLNYYGLSKYLFDEWVLDNPQKPPQYVGLKFFNVYGPNEYHKGFMASVVYHGFNEISKTGKIRLFKSYKKDFKNGEQKRDFIYVEDVVKIILFFIDNVKISGIFNVGTGNARTFLDLAKSIFTALYEKPNIVFIDMPIGLKEKYQYFTQANMSNLRKVGYKNKMISLEEGVRDYVENYLQRSQV